MTTYDIVFTPVLHQKEVAVNLTWHVSYITETRIPSTLVSHWLKIDVHYNLKFLAVSTKLTAFCDVTLYGLVAVYRQIARTCRLHLDDRRWRQMVPPKNWHLSIKTHDIIFQKTIIWIHMELVMLYSGKQYSQSPPIEQIISL